MSSFLLAHHHHVSTIETRMGQRQRPWVGHRRNGRTLPTRSAEASSVGSSDEERVIVVEEVTSTSKTDKNGNVEEVVDIFASQELADELQEREDLGKRGETWVLASIAAVALIIFPPMQLKGMISMMGTISVAAGLVFILYALFSLGRNFSPLASPRKKHTLVTSGMYSYVRHPMYAGVLLAALGVAALSLSEARLALTVLLWWILERKVDLEERLLSERYGAYKQYAEEVPRFLPRFI